MRIRPGLGTMVSIGQSVAAFGSSERKSRNESKQDRLKNAVRTAVGYGSDRSQTREETPRKNQNWYFTSKLISRPSIERASSTPPGPVGTPATRAKPSV